MIFTATDRLDIFALITPGEGGTDPFAEGSVQNALTHALGRLVQDLPDLGLKSLRLSPEPHSYGGGHWGVEWVTADDPHTTHTFFAPLDMWSRRPDGVKALLPGPVQAALTRLNDLTVDLNPPAEDPRDPDPDPAAAI